MNINDKIQIRFSPDELTELVQMLRDANYESIESSYSRVMALFLCRNLYNRLAVRMSKLLGRPKSIPVTFNAAEASALFLTLSIDTDYEDNRYRQALIWKVTSIIDHKFA